MKKFTRISNVKETKYHPAKDIYLTKERNKNLNWVRNKNN